MDERRRHPRNPVSWPARLWIDEESLVICATKDISVFGLCLATAPTAAVKVGRSYRVDVLAEGNGHRTFQGAVRRIDEHGIGLASDRPLL